ncbi:MAG: hypothetical protein QOJ73_2592, partial [Streptosporangiaceae bacterium]|nr:hypothetical protein [Streptosporangiaceae bacterium]
MTISALLLPRRNDTRARTGVVGNGGRRRDNGLMTETEPQTSKWSLWSEGSILSIGSKGSVLSIGSV